MKALTIKQPWAWCILHAGKNVENRSWAPSTLRLRPGDRLAIHAGKTFDKDGFRRLRGPGSPLRPASMLPDIGDPRYVFGAIIGTVQFDGVDDDPSLRWGQRGKLQWLLSDPVWREPVHMAGFLGLWEWTP